jgi:hypothetical protein
MRTCFTALGFAGASVLSTAAFAGYSTGFEASQGYVQGSIVGQNGWTALTGSAQYDVNDGVNAGNGSANALRVTQTSFPNNGGLLRSPLVTGSTHMSIDVRVDDNQGAGYSIVGTSEPASTQTFRVKFEYDGLIYYQVGASLIPTITWSPNTYKTLDVLITGSTIEYRYGGSLFATQTTFNAGGSTFDQVKFTHSNDQDLGFGSFSGGGNPAACYFDNLTIVPAPGTGVLLAISGLVVARRRRS